MEVHTGLVHCAEELDKGRKRGHQAEVPPTRRLGLRALPRCRTFALKMGLYRANEASESH